MTQKNTYKITFQPGANRGSFAIDAIADTIGGDWSGSTDDMGFVTFPAEHAEVMDELLDADDQVIGYEEYKTEVA